jgi:hypothetical protein
VVVAAIARRWSSGAIDRVRTVGAIERGWSIGAIDRVRMIGAIDRCDRARDRLAPSGRGRDGRDASTSQWDASRGAVVGGALPRRARRSSGRDDRRRRAACLARAGVRRLHLGVSTEYRGPQDAPRIPRAPRDRSMVLGVQ